MKSLQYHIVKFILRRFGTARFYEINIPNKRNVNYSDISDIEKGNETSDVLNNSPRKLLEWFEGRIDESMFQGKTILDLGCGFGGRAIYYAKSGNCRECIGIDLDADGIREARKYAGYIGQNNVRFDFGDGENMPYDSDYFDLVFSFDVLEHVNDVERVMEEVYRVLKPGGLFCSVFPPYYSVNGSHVKRTDFPWMNVLFSTKTTYDVLTGEYGDNYELWEHRGKILRKGLNGTTIKDFEEFLARSRYKVAYIKYGPILSKPTNAYKKLQNKLVRGTFAMFFAAIRKIPFLEEFLTHRIVFILEK